MTSPVPGRPTSSLRSRLKVYHLYYVLALFDLATVSVTLALIIWITGKYERSVEINDFWAGRLEACLELSHRAADVNAPGNDIFETDLGTPEQLDAALDRAARRLDEAQEAYADLSRRMSATLAAHRDRSEVVPLLEAIMAENDAEVAAMVLQARAIFDHFAAGERDAAGEPMARMDRHYASLTRNMSRLGEWVIAIQSLSVDEQVAAARTLRRVEYIVASLIVVMVIAVAVYGATLARQGKAEARRTEERLERDVAERTAELQASYEQLRLTERLASIGTLAAGLGHDMSNVLFPVRCRLDAIESAGVDPAVRDEVDGMRKSVDYLQQLSDGLRQLSLDPDDTQASAGTTDPATWWREVGPLLRTALPRGAEFEADVPESPPPVAIATHALTQAVFNLVVNAGEAIGEKGTVAFAIAVSEDDRQVIFTVRDNGPGMSDEVRRRALDPFFTTKTRGLSTGLGLALVHGAVQSAGGHVDIESVPGEGTAVHITLPVAVADDVDAGPRAATVSVADPRTAGLATTLLDAAGFELRDTDADSLEQVDLWVTDVDPASHALADAFLATGERRLVALGGDPDEREAWKAMGAITINGSGDLASLRRAIGRATSRGDRT